MGFVSLAIASNSAFMSIQRPDCAQLRSGVDQSDDLRCCSSISVIFVFKVSFHSMNAIYRVYDINGVQASIERNYQE